MNSKITSINRSVIISKEEIQYKLRFSKKAKYLRLQISGGQGLELIVPRGYELKEAEEFLIKKAGWIKKHLKSYVKTAHSFTLFGKEIKISQSYQLFIEKHKIAFRDGELKITSPAGSKDQLLKIYDTWLKHISQTYIRNRVMSVSDEMGIIVKKVSIKSQKTRWGSASTRGNLSFNYRLMKYRKEVIDYVIIHELCHLKEMNHSNRFWDLVEKFCPDFRLYRKELKNS